MKIGLTGGIGCGKSTVAEAMAGHGWQTLETDAVVRRLLAEDAPVRRTLLERWGGAILGEDGEVDRKAVGRIVFGSEEELDWLEGVLHPRVREAWEGFLRETAGGCRLVEIPLLFEKKLESGFDFTVCVRSPLELADRRLRDRGFASQDIGRRRRRQLSLGEKVRRSDFVISNAGSLEFLHQQCARLNAQLRAS